MTTILVKKEGSKFKVLVNWVQNGIQYSSEALAKMYADKIAASLNGDVKILDMV